METKEREVGRNGANVQQRKLEQRAERFDNCRRQDTNCYCVGKERYLVVIVRAVIDTRKPERIGSARIAERRMSTEAGNQNDEDYEVEPCPSLAVTSFGETLSRGLIPVHLHLLEEGPHQD
jgi:hypothetical protein